MNWLKKHWLVTILLVLPFIILAVVWNELPEEIPVHWNAKGEVDRYGSRYELLLLPCLSILTYLLVVYLPRLDPKKKVNQFKGVLEKIGLLMVAFMFLIFVMILMVTLGMDINVTAVVFTAVVMLFLVLGNYMGKFRPNYFVGIRTPWTLENEEVWVKTHRFSGALWVSASIGMLFYILLGQPFKTPGSTEFFVVFTTYVLLCSLVPLVYSYFVYKRLSEEQSENPTD